MLKKYTIGISKFSLLFVLVLSFYPSLCLAVFNRSLYLGIAGGYGSTTWEGLVPSAKNKNFAMSISTPIAAHEGGTLWGLLGGYEFTSYFALEASYMIYPKAKIQFDSFSSFSFDHNELTSFISETETVSLVGKIMLMIPDTSIRVYSSAGVTRLHRFDLLADRWRLSPTFGVGLNHYIGEHFLIELAGNYTAGYGEAQLNPTETYFPFLYSAAVHFAYYF